MESTAPHLVDSAPLPYLLALPEGAGLAAGGWPVLCFLHGYEEGAPMPIHQGLTLHGPLRRTSAARARREFVVVAPQLPTRGDVWYRYADAVREIVRQVQALHGGDPERTYLTGFSFGGNGVFDLALTQRDCWAALWAVDPTRVPERDPRRPTWISAGEVARRREQGFLRRLQLEVIHDGAPGDRVYVDQGYDHVGAATSAYGDDRIYRWLLAKRLAIPAA